MFDEMNAYVINDQGCDSCDCDGGPSDGSGCDCDQCDASDGGNGS